MPASSSNSACTSDSHESSNPGEDPAVVAHIDGDGGEFDEAGGDHPSDVEADALPDIADPFKPPPAAPVADAALHDHVAAHIAVAAPAWDVGVELAEINKTAQNNVVFAVSGLPRVAYDCGAGRANQHRRSYTRPVLVRFLPHARFTARPV